MSTNFSISMFGVVIATGALVVDAHGAPVKAHISGPALVCQAFVLSLKEAVQNADAIDVVGYDPDAIDVEATVL